MKGGLQGTLRPFEASGRSRPILYFSRKKATLDPKFSSGWLESGKYGEKRGVWDLPAFLASTAGLNLALGTVSLVTGVLSI